MTLSRGKVLVLGASGFIGAHLAATLAAEGWQVIAGARRPDAARRLAPGFNWVRAEFGELQTPEAWAPLLDQVEAVVNCVGVLQDAPGDSTEIAHVRGPAALFAACELAGVRRLVHVSAVGADEAAGTAYARSKFATERLLEQTRLDGIVLRPSLVLARAVYGGTALIRGLAAFPLVIPVIGGEQRFRPVAMSDLAGLIVRLLEPGAPSRTVLEVAGPEEVSLTELLRRYRGWLGLGPAPVVRAPGWVAHLALALGDLAGRLGWTSSMRTTSLKQMAYNVAGDPERWVELTGVRPMTVAELMSREPASVQDRWHARLYFVRPLAIVTLGGFWLLTGLITLGPGHAGAVELLRGAGLSPLAARVSTDLGAWFDVVMGLLLFIRPWTRAVALAMALATLGYLAAATALLPRYWIDPLGPWLKVLPMMALCLLVTATDERR